MDDDMRRRDRIRGLESLRIDDAYFSCLCPMRRLAANSAHIVLERVLGAVGECLDRQSAEALIRLRADQQMQGRIEELADKSTEGILTPEGMSIIRKEKFCDDKLPQLFSPLSPQPLR